MNINVMLHTSPLELQVCGMNLVHWKKSKWSIFELWSDSVTDHRTCFFLDFMQPSFANLFIYLQSSLGLNSDSVLKIKIHPSMKDSKIFFLYPWIHHNHFLCLISFKGLPEHGFRKNISEKKERDRRWLFKRPFLSTACSLVSCTISLILGKQTRSWLAKISCEILSTHYFFARTWWCEIGNGNFFRTWFVGAVDEQ